MTRIEEVQKQLLAHRKVAPLDQEAAVQPDPKWRMLRPRWAILSVFATLAALAVFGGIVGYTYVRGASNEMPVIQANSEPIKSFDPAPDQGNPPVESLIPSPETPLQVQIEKVEAEATTELEALALAGPLLEYTPGPVENLL